MMGANRSSAVMQQRRDPPDELDYFPTPPFATRALCEFLAGRLGELGQLTAWEPAAGEGHMVRPLQEYFASVRASDVFPYLWAAQSDELPELELLDFAMLGRLEPAVDVVASNPPFILALEFIENALQVARVGVAMLVRSAFLETEGRLDELFLVNPPTYVLQFAERVVMLKGRLVRKGDVDWGADEATKAKARAKGKEHKASTATAYSWLVWLRDPAGNWDDDTRLRWIPVSIDRLERPGDYPSPPIETLPPPADGLFGSLAHA